MVGKKLSKLAEDFKVPFEFQAAHVYACDVQVQHLGVRSGEALAINFVFMPHHICGVTLARKHKGRINVEQHCLARDAVSIIACEGDERVERTA
ncbi:Scarecrow protein 5 [Spatholobus suberectus]|nr:Scarecrow protein 5 [Spatholobus suberectus]